MLLAISVSSVKRFLGLAFPSPTVLILQSLHEGSQRGLT